MMIGLKYLMVILFVVMTASCSDTRQSESVKSVPDNQENRTAAAKRYLEVMPVKDMLHGLANRVVQAIPEPRRKAFMEVMESPGMEQATTRITLDNLVKHFTVGELNVLVAFYGSPDGKSALKKLGPFMADVMSQIQQEVKKAMPETQTEPESKVQPKPPAQPQPPGPKPQTEQKASPGKK
jgi:hypothetical protein